MADPIGSSLPPQVRPAESGASAKARAAQAAFFAEALQRSRALAAGTPEAVSALQPAAKTQTPTSPVTARNAAPAPARAEAPSEPEANPRLPRPGSFVDIRV